MKEKILLIVTVLCLVAQLVCIILSALDQNWMALAGWLNAFLFTLAGASDYYNGY